MQVGIDTSAAAYTEASLAVSPADRLRDLLAQIEHADQVGLDTFGIGEHHRAEYLDSAPGVILGAAAARTRNTRLQSGACALRGGARVRVFETCSTVASLSRARSDVGGLR